MNDTQHKGDTHAYEGAANAEELLELELQAAQQLRAFLGAYVNFPTADNFDLTAQKMREYQTAWMNGRERKF